MTIGQRIKSARERLSLTQEEVAQMCQTTKQTIFKYENEIVTNVPYDKIVLLCRALQVSPAYLFNWPEKKENPGEPKLTGEEELLLKLFRQIPADRQPEALQLLEVALKMQKKR